MTTYTSLGPAPEGYEVVNIRGDGLDIAFGPNRTPVIAFVFDEDGSVYPVTPRGVELSGALLAPDNSVFSIPQGPRCSGSEVSLSQWVDHAINAEVLS